MNYIAHAWVSRSFGHFMLGQLLGDFALASEIETCHDDTIRGVKAHRELDRFTDSHGAFIAGCKILSVDCYKYAPVIMDILMDRVLVVNWDLLHPEQPFEAFLRQVYSGIEEFENGLPKRMETPARRMRSMDWFSGFAVEHEFDRVFYYLSRRVRKPEWVLAAPDSIRNNWKELEPLGLTLLQSDHLHNFSVNGF